MTTPDRFLSQAPNAQDVVLRRALATLGRVRGIELVEDGSAPLLTALDADVRTVRDLRAAGAGDPAGPLHVLSLHGRDRLGDALARLAQTPPWIVVVTDAGARLSAPQADGYRAVLFDGVSDYLLHDEHPELAPALSYAACSRDDFTTAERAELLADLARWRTRALDAWASRSIEPAQSAAARELAELKASTSWRITAPVRTVVDRVPARFRG